MNIHFNTNILETNIINLAIVIGIVIFFVGDALRSLLDDRAKLIFANLDEANQKAKKAEEKFIASKLKLEEAKKKADEIEQQGIITVDNNRAQSETQTLEIIQRLEVLRKETLIFQQQNVLKLLAKKVIQSSTAQARKKLTNCKDSNFQNSMNNFYIALLRNYE